MRGYMRENKISYAKLFKDIQEWMKEDGFFDLSGLNDMIAEMYPETQEKPKKVPQDHKKKDSTK